MSEVEALQSSALHFLAPYLPPPPGARQPSRHATAADLPFVTLTYATSLDSMIALAPGVRTTLSGPETKSMTHYLRSRHDAILVGARTARVDDPALNCRYPSSSSSVLAHQPRPVIVDPRRRWDGRDTKVARLARERTGKAPWVVQRRGASCASEFLPEIGGLALCVGEDDDDDDAAADGDDDATRGRELSWEAILKSLKARGIDSVMVEGGATVMNALLGQPRLVDAVIVTIAPTFLGRGGVAVAPAPKTVRGERVNAAWIDETCWRQFGDDVVLCGRLRGGEDV